MDLLYGLGIAIVVLILIIRDKHKRKSILSKKQFCPKCKTVMETVISIEHIKKVRYNSKTYYGDFAKEHIIMKCPNCGYSIQYDNN